MNLIELENLVKGVPDDYLTKEVQAPSGKIPPFLALSEIQRRKDMRQRYEAQKGAVDKPTIAQQLTGGIGAMQQQGAPAPAMPGGAGAPPVAAGAAPMPTPPGQPQGFAAGGQVGYAEGGPVKPKPTYNRRGYLETYWNPELQAIKRIPGSLEEMLANSQNAVLDMAAGKPSAAYPEAGWPTASLFGAQVGGPEAVRKMADRQVADDRSALAQEIASSVNLPPPAQVPAVADVGYTGNVPEYLLRNRGAGASSAPSAPSAATQTAGPAPVISRGGIGEFPVPAMTPIPGGPATPAAKGQPGELVAETAQEQAYLDALEKGFDLPEAINYDEFIAAAGQEEAAIRAAAKQEALGAALVQLGAGLAAGNMAAGFSEAGTQAQQIMKEGRRDAAAQRALGQELKLKGMEGARTQAIEQKRLDLDIAKSLADFAGGSRKEREDRQFRLMEMQQRAQQAAASLQASQAAYGLNQRKYELDLKVNAIDFREKMAREAAGPQPTQKTMDAYELSAAMARRTGQAPPPNPMEAWNSRYRNALPDATALAAKTFGLPAESLYIKSEAVKPISNPPTTGWSIQKVR